MLKSSQKKTIVFKVITSAFDACTSESVPTASF